MRKWGARLIKMGSLALGLLNVLIIGIPKLFGNETMLYGENTIGKGKSYMNYNLSNFDLC